MTLFTPPTHRGQGHARALIEEVKTFTRERGKSLELFARAFADRPVPTPKLVEFYESCGFRITRKDHDTVWLQWTPPEVVEP